MRWNGVVMSAIGFAAAAAIAAGLAGFWPAEHIVQQQSALEPVMLILRGIPDDENPRGQLDDSAAMEYARRLGFRGEVLDVAGNAAPESPQVKMALNRIRQDENVAALYGFSAGGYSARQVWKALAPPERERIRKVVVVGSPGVTDVDFNSKPEVVIQPDPPEGHFAGPKALLGSVAPESVGRGQR